MKAFVKQWMGLACVAALAMSALAPGAARADDWPNRPITLIVPFPPGGMTDLLARRLAQDMQRELKQTTLVENRPGASGQIGTAYVARARNDGYTLLVSATHQVVNPAVKKNLPYDAAKDFSDIALLATAPNTLVVNSSLPIHTLAEFIAYAHKQPGGISYASSGVGSATQMTGELIRLNTGAPMVHIPYAGAAPAVSDLLGGTLPAMSLDVTTVIPYIQEGRLRALGVAGPKRVSILPDVPTMAELGYPAVEASTWIGFYGPAKLPAAMVDRLNRIAIASMGSPEMTRMLAEKGTTPETLKPAEFHRFVGKELVKWKKVVQDANIEAQ